ncbi:FeoA family protein [Marispirochaeta sp.]|jgi:ferrous iron transport protein A|uniref:FeoA family protein n=1 Tax=Marispirochaeta sp. TaxID=2038653 RepID=UPI0029C62D4F|nr:FeoA family protein [Marispirochaeta sp.]
MESGINNLNHQLIPLSDVRPGTDVVIRAFRGGRGMRQRLLDLGVVPGERIRVIRGGRGMPHVLMVKTSKIMLGHGIVRHILVSPPAAGDPENGPE